MGFLKKLGKKLKKGVKKVGKGIKRGVKKLGQNIKKYGPTLLSVASTFVPGLGLGGLLGKAGGLISKVAPKLGGFIGNLGNLGHGTGLFGKEGGFLSGQGALSKIFGGTGGGGFSQLWKGGGDGGGLMGMLDPSGDGLFDPTSLGGMLSGGGAGGGLGGLLAAGAGAYGMSQQGDSSIDVDSAMSGYDHAMGKAGELEQYYKDLADPNSQMNKAMADTMQERSMDQAAMASLQAERMSPGGITSGMQAERQHEIMDNASETAAQNFENYMTAQSQMGAQGLQANMPLYAQMGNERTSLNMYNQQLANQASQNKADIWNQVGGGLLDYGLEQFT